MSWLRRIDKDSHLIKYKDLCSEGLCDIHAHLLPGVDDGPVSFDESIQMLEGMAALGYTYVTATPHFDNRASSNGTSIIDNNQKELISKWGDRVPQLYFGAEIPFDDFFFQNERTFNFPCLGPTRTYLVETGFQPGSIPSGIEDVFFRLQAKGMNLLLAHPERIPDFQKDPPCLKRICQTGTYLQLDVMSLVGRYGTIAQRTAFNLLEMGLIDFASSDLHSPNDLGTLDRALSSLANLDEQAFVRLASLNPMRLLKGRLCDIERYA